jgi:hypothetical protein
LGGRYRSAIIKGLLTYPKFINTSHVASLGATPNIKALAIKAEVEMESFEHALSKVPQAKSNKHQGIVVAAVGIMEAEIVGYVHKVMTKHKSFKEVLAANFDEALKQLESSAKNPFRDAPAVKVKASTAASSVQQLGKFGLNSAQLAKIAADMGIVADVEIMHTESKAMFVVSEVDIEEGVVVMHKKGDKRRKLNVELQKVCDEYKTYEVALVRCSSR